MDNTLSWLAALLLLLGVALGNLLLLLAGLGLLAYSFTASVPAAAYVGLPEVPERPPAVAAPTAMPEDARQPQVASSTGAQEPTPPGSFVHVPLYQETFPYERQALDAAYVQEAITRNAVDPPLHHGDKRVEFIQFLNEGKGPCRKDHWMVQADMPPQPSPPRVPRRVPAVAPPAPDATGGAETTS